IEPADQDLPRFKPQALVLHAPELEADPAEDGTRTGTFVVLHPSRSEVLIGGTFYAGEIKKSIFTLMNDRLPLEGVFPMHCSANVGEDGKVAIFFGLSGTGKTTLSADPERLLIGDADRSARSEPGALLLPLRIHGEAGWDGDRRDRAAADLLDLLRRAVPAAGAGRLRADARAEARPPHARGLARQHGLDGRAVRRGR